MNHQEYLGKFEYWDIQLNTMLKTISNFDKLNRSNDFIINKSRKYYQRINTISIWIIKNRDMQYMRLDTFDMENKVQRAKELLDEAFEKRNIRNQWASVLPDLN